MKKYDLPAMPFYPGDWFKAPEIRALPPDYRGLWFDCICYMWESTERGVFLKPNGQPYTKEEIVRMVGLDNQNSGNWLTYIIESEVCSIRESDGAIYCRKMVRDEEIRIKRKNAGMKGGNPILLNQEVNYEDKQKVNHFPENENENESSLKKNNKECEVVSYFLAKGYSEEEGKEFFNHYEGQGWVTGNGIPISNWKAKAETWHLQQLKKNIIENKSYHDKGLKKTQPTTINSDIQRIADSLRTANG